MWDKKILTVFMQWDYGREARGPSMEKTYFYENLKRLASSVEPFWYDEYLRSPDILRAELIRKAEEYRPDLIFFLPYTEQFSPDTLDVIRAKWVTCAWFGDDTWRFESYTARLAPHFTHVLTTDLFSIEKYRKLAIDPILTQWAADPRNANKPGMSGRYEHEVSFVGAKDPVRAWFIMMLRKLGIDVSCFGAGWPAGRVSSDEMDHIFRASRINLNLSNTVPRDIRYVLGGITNFAKYCKSKKTAEQIKARNFEIPMSGGFQLSNYVPDLERYFQIGREISVYTTPEECAHKIRYYLANESVRAAIATAGAERALREHTYMARLGSVLGTIWG